MWNEPRRDQMGSDQGRWWEEEQVAWGCGECSQPSSQKGLRVGLELTLLESWFRNNSLAKFQAKRRFSVTISLLLYFMKCF